MNSVIEHAVDDAIDEVKRRSPAAPEAQPVVVREIAGMNLVKWAEEMNVTLPTVSEQEVRLEREIEERLDVEF